MPKIPALSARRRQAQEALKGGRRLKDVRETAVATTVLVETDRAAMTVVLDHVEGESADDFGSRLRDAVAATEEALDALGGP